MVIILNKKWTRIETKLTIWHICHIILQRRIDDKI